MRQVIHVITTIARGGAENQLKVLIREQVRTGFSVEVIYLKDSPELKNKLIELGAKVNDTFSGEKPLVQYSILKRLLKDFDGIVHAHLPRAELLCAFATKGKNLIVSKHNCERFFPSGPKLLSKILSRFVEDRAKAVVTISVAVRDFLYDCGELKAHSKIHVIHYGYDIDFDNKYKVTTKHVSKCFVVGTVARLTEQKDIPTLLRAFMEFNNKVPNSRLHLIGSGKLLNQLVKLGKELGIDQFVMWLGRTEDVASEMRQMNIFVLPSRYEGFGLVILEAIQLRVPVLAARNAAVVEVLGKHSDALFELGNSNELFQKLLELNDYRKREVLICSQKERLKVFEPAKMNLKMTTLYSKVNEG